jgi:hypothetical protein
MEQPKIKFVYFLPNHPTVDIVDPVTNEKLTLDIAKLAGFESLMRESGFVFMKCYNSGIELPSDESEVSTERLPADHKYISEADYQY